MADIQPSERIYIPLKRLNENILFQSLLTDIISDTTTI